jgi:hypothetical protein
MRHPPSSSEHRQLRKHSSQPSGLASLRVKTRKQHAFRSYTTDERHTRLRLRVLYLSMDHELLLLDEWAHPRREDLLHTPSSAAA